MSIIITLNRTDQLGMDMTIQLENVAKIGLTVAMTCSVEFDFLWEILDSSRALTVTIYFVFSVYILLCCT